MNRNEKLLAEFTEYCKANPDQRFWQALRNWSGAASLWFFDGEQEGEDTFYWEDKTS